MEPDTFELLEQARARRGDCRRIRFPDRTIPGRKKYPSLFETRLMRKRLELGLDPIQMGSL